MLELALYVVYLLAVPFVLLLIAVTVKAIVRKVRFWNETRYLRSVLRDECSYWYC